MQRSSSQSSAPIPFRGFGLCIASVLVAYFVLVGSLGMGIRHALDRPAAVASVATTAPSSVLTLSGDAPVVKANVAE